MPISLNPGVQTLILKYNQFRSVDASFNFYSDLAKVDLSHNHLVTIPDRSFKSQRKLRDLRMRGNKISEITTETFVGLAKLETLDLRSNLLEKIGSKVFQSLAGLKELNLGNNRIKKIKEGAFEGLSELSILHLDDNQLTSIPTKALKILTNLAELHLSRNNFKVVKEEAFLGLSSLSFLDLSGNKIKRLEERSLEGLSQLKLFKLNDNQLETVPTEHFQNLDSLEDLTIGQNKFTVIGESAFAPLSKLRVIDISGCPNLQQVESDAFSANPDLENVEIHSNRRLSSLHPSSFSNCPNLRHVNLANNALVSLSPDLLPWPRLKSAQLTGNPWNCDCSALFLRDVIISLVNASSQVRVTRCWGPPARRDQDIALLRLPSCEMDRTVHSPNIANSSVALVPTTVIAVVAISIALVFATVTVLLLHFRQEAKDCLKRWRCRKNRSPVSTKDILCYDEDPEPRYVSPYAVPGLTGHHQAGLYNTYQEINTNNNQARTLGYPQSLVRHDQYFITLARQDLRMMEKNEPISQL